MPAVEARDAGGLVGGRDDRLVKGCVGSGPECDALDAFVVIDGAITDKLHLRHARDGYQVRMEDGVCGPLDHIIAMSMRLGHGFKCLRGKTTGRTGVSDYLC